jgi:hypothetical protein
MRVEELLRYLCLSWATITSEELDDPAAPEETEEDESDPRYSSSEKSST